MNFEPTLVAKVIEVDRSLEAAGIAHAFGGAIALAYCAKPRGTKDIDINVAVEPSHLDDVLDALPAASRPREIAAPLTCDDMQRYVD